MGESPRRHRRRGSAQIYDDDSITTRHNMCMGNGTKCVRLHIDINMLVNLWHSLTKQDDTHAQNGGKIIIDRRNSKRKFDYVRRVRKRKVQNARQGRTRCSALLCFTIMYSIYSTYLVLRVYGKSSTTIH